MIVRSRPLGLAALLLLLLVPAVPTAAQARPDPPAPTIRGFVPKARALATSSWSFREIGPGAAPNANVRISAAGGGGMELLYDLGRHLSPYVAADINAETEGIFMTYSAGLNLHSQQTSPFEPYLRGGIGYLSGPVDFPYVAFGGGVEWRLSSPVALDLGIELTEPFGDTSRDTGLNEVDIALDGDQRRLFFGLSWYPARRPSRQSAQTASVEISCPIQPSLACAR